VITSVRIANFRSISSLHVDDLGDLNVFFGRNNVGKSNILRALNLAFYCLKGNRPHIPDTCFHNRNVYKPIVIEFMLMGPILIDGERSLGHELLTLAGELPELTDDTSGEIELEAVALSRTLQATEVPGNPRVRVEIPYDDDASDPRIEVYGNGSGSLPVRNIRGHRDAIRGKLQARERLARQNMINATLEDFETPDANRIVRELVGALPIRNQSDLASVPVRYLERAMDRILSDEGLLSSLGAPRDYVRAHLTRLVSAARSEIRTPSSQFLTWAEKAVTAVESYLEAIGNSFALLPSQHFLQKGARSEVDGVPITEFQRDRFYETLLGMIESPTLADRERIQRFSKLFGENFSEIGAVQLSKFRERVLGILDTPHISLPVEEQGKGVQDLFVFICYLTLFPYSVVAIEEPEAGLSVWNQRQLIKTIAEVTADPGKQVMLSSHSDVFEGESSYLVEMSDGVTTVVSRAAEREQYESRIDRVLMQRNLAQQIEEYQTLLRSTAEIQARLAILEFIDGLSDDEQIDASTIAQSLGLKESFVDGVIADLVSRRSQSR